MILPNAIDILGVRVVPLKKSQLVETLTTWASKKQKRLVSHVNVHGVNLAQSNDRFRSVINNADLVFCDGHGVMWGASQLGRVIPERLAVMDWIDDFAACLADRGLSLFLLGDEKGVAELCGGLLERAHPGLVIAGTHHGFFEKNGRQSAEVVEKVNASGASVVMVGFGMPLQEFWIEENFQGLNASVIMPVGATFRWYAGVEKRAPKWMTDRGLEWVGRLARHPLRMFRRYVIGNPLFAARVLAQRRHLSEGKPVG
ncbi:MAG: WecB/TagA/CpsF family glycosyltransferase [Acidimicrobiia bacterium]|nr:WecB/TagA/CpsF family glycosyltransferase [Acidimicrobiia bacterium]